MRLYGSFTDSAKVTLVWAADTASPHVFLALEHLGQSSKVQEMAGGPRSEAGDAMIERPGTPPR
jgi:hypothetical protein